VPGTIALGEVHDISSTTPLAGRPYSCGTPQRNGGAAVSEIVRYRVDDETVAQFEIDPVPGFHPAGAGDIAGRVWESAGTAVEAAKVLLDRVKEVAPDSVQVKFGVKVTGTANWIVAKASTEGNFEITLAWQSGELSGSGAASGN
jgi:hypothetical protein